MLKIIKSNTWQEDSVCAFRRKLGGKITVLILTKQFAYRPHLHFIFAVAALVAFLFGQTAITVIICIIWPITMLMLQTDKVPAADLHNVEILTQENSQSIMAKAGWSLAGGMVLGAAGLLAGAIGGGNKQTTGAMLYFSEDRRALVQGPVKLINELTLHCVKI